MCKHQAIACHLTVYKIVIVLASSVIIRLLFAYFFNNLQFGFSGPSFVLFDRSFRPLIFDKY